MYKNKRKNSQREKEKLTKIILYTVLDGLEMN